MYIVIEGVKGSGKSTLIDALPAYLQARGLPVVVLCPTRAMPAWHPLEKAAAQFPMNDAELEQLYAARSNYHAAKVPANAALILGDRSILTSYATRWPQTSLTEQQQYIAHVNHLEHRISQPDHVLMLNVPLSSLLERLHRRTERLYGKHEETAERLRATLEAYQEIRNRAAPLGLQHITWHDIDANTAPTQVLHQVAERIEQLWVEKHGLKAA